MKCPSAGSEGERVASSDRSTQCSAEDELHVWNPLMEDIALSAALRRAAGRPAALRPPAVTSARRWERDGVLRTILLMWSLRLRYFLGESPRRLHRRYYGGPP